MKFSVLQAVYKKDSPVFLDQCFDSIFRSTVQPEEVVLVKDGKLTSELDSIISKWSKFINLIVVGYDENHGLAHALNFGLQYISTDLIARMDSDDYCYPARFEKQLELFSTNPNIEICGTAISEFYITENQERIRIRTYPNKIDKTSKYLFKGTPLGHPTLMIKTDLLKRFRYSEETKMNEDIDLWFRLIKDNHVINNIEEPLLNFRITDGTFKRRSFKKAINEFQIYKKNLEKLFGINWRMVYPIARLISRFLPYSINKRLYFSKSREKLLCSKGEL